MDLIGQVFYFFLLSIYVSIIFFFGYTFIFADCDDVGLNGRISRFLYERLPELFSKAVLKLAGPAIYKELLANYNYVVNERNPIMQFVYLAVFNSCFICWLIFGASKLPNSMIGYHHRYIAYVGLAACHYSFYIACQRNPGILTKENVRCFAHHEYDGVLYVEGFSCRTCEVKKVHCCLKLLADIAN